MGLSGQIEEGNGYKLRDDENLGKREPTGLVRDLNRSRGCLMNGRTHSIFSSARTSASQRERGRDTRKVLMREMSRPQGELGSGNDF